jgi:hypothetical protein
LLKSVSSQEFYQRSQRGDKVTLFKSSSGHCDKKVALYCEKHLIKEMEFREDGKRREVTKARGEIAYYLSREMG